MVIQIPNPLLLPQSYGMGEVAGMGFGSNYVMLMQIVYNYYAPRVIKEMEDGNLDTPMDTIWWGKWQRFMTKYSDQSIQNTMDRVLDIPDKVLDSIWEKMSSWLTGGQGDENDTSLTSASLLGETFEVRSGGGRRNELESGGFGTETAETKRKRLEKEAKNKKNQEQLEREAAARNRIADEIRTQKARLALEKEVSRTGVVTSKRKAGQSQIKERNKLIQQISGASNNIKKIRAGSSPYTPDFLRQQKTTKDRLITLWTNTMRTAQAKLTILLQRYIF